MKWGFRDRGTPAWAYTGPMTIITAKTRVDDDGNELVTYLVRLDEASEQAIRRIVREEISNMLQNEQHHGREKHDASD